MVCKFFFFWGDTLNLDFKPRQIPHRLYTVIQNLVYRESQGLRHQFESSTGAKLTHKHLWSRWQVKCPQCKEKVAFEARAHVFFSVESSKPFQWEKMLGLLCCQTMQSVFEQFCCFCLVFQNDGRPGVPCLDLSDTNPFASTAVG